MGVADADFALQKLYQFRDLQESASRYLMDEVPVALETAISKLEPYIEDVARSLGEKRVADVAGNSYSAMAVANRLIGRLEEADDWERTFGPEGPTLSASGLHPWVWNAVASLWDDGHYEPAVHQAGLAVQLQTQLKVSRRDLHGKDLYAQAFSVVNGQWDLPSGGQ